MEGVPWLPISDTTIRPITISTLETTPIGCLIALPGAQGGGLGCGGGGPSRGGGCRSGGSRTAGRWRRRRRAVQRPGGRGSGRRRAGRTPPTGAGPAGRADYGGWMEDFPSHIYGGYVIRGSGMTCMTYMTQVRRFGYDIVREVWRNNSIRWASRKKI